MSVSFHNGIRKNNNKDAMKQVISNFIENYADGQNKVYMQPEFLFSLFSSFLRFLASL